MNEFGSSEKPESNDLENEEVVIPKPPVTLPPGFTPLVPGSTLDELEEVAEEAESDLEEATVPETDDARFMPSGDSPSGTEETSGEDESGLSGPDVASIFAKVESERLAVEEEDPVPAIGLSTVGFSAPKVKPVMLSAEAVYGNKSEPEVTPDESIDETIDEENHKILWGADRADDSEPSISEEEEIPVLQPEEESGDVSEEATSEESSSEEEEEDDAGESVAEVLAVTEDDSQEADAILEESGEESDDESDGVDESDEESGELVEESGELEDAPILSEEVSDDSESADDPLQEEEGETEPVSSEDEAEEEDGEETGLEIAGSQPEENDEEASDEGAAAEVEEELEESEAADEEGAEIEETPVDPTADGEEEDEDSAADSEGEEEALAPAASEDGEDQEGEKEKSVLEILAESLPEEDEEVVDEDEVESDEDEESEDEESEDEEKAGANLPDATVVAGLVAKARESEADEMEVVDEERERRRELFKPEPPSRGWAFWRRSSKRDQQLARVSEGYLEMVDLVRAISKQLQSQTENNLILRDSLSHLPEAMKGLESFSKSQRTVGKALKEIHGQLKNSGTKEQKLVESMEGFNDTLKGMDDTGRATMKTFDRVQERMRDSDIRMENLFQKVQTSEEKVSDTMVRLQRNMAIMQSLFLIVLMIVIGVLVFVVIGAKDDKPDPVPVQTEGVEAPRE